MDRVYIIYYDYRHTRGNHAGMAYLARKLKAANPYVRLVKQPPQEYKGGWIPALGYALLLAVSLKFKLRPGDQVVFFEYLSGDFGFQDRIVRWLRRWSVENHFSGIVHLGGAQLLDLYRGAGGVKKRLNRIDRILVFGSSLYDFLSKQVEYTREIIHTYHYADTDYYRPVEDVVEAGTNRLQVLFLGAIKRNLDQLREIISQTRGAVDFHICVGKGGHTPFLGLSNVTVHGYMEESELLGLMRRCDVNLSVFYDTIGSNAVTGTLAVGLVQVASHVGSIEDYGDPSNSIWCDSTADFVRGLLALSADRKRLHDMKRSARKKAESISLRRFISDFNMLFSSGRDDRTKT